MKKPAEELKKKMNELYEKYKNDFTFKKLNEEEKKGHLGEKLQEFMDHCGNNNVALFIAKEDEFHCKFSNDVKIDLESKTKELQNLIEKNQLNGERLCSIHKLYTKYDLIYTEYRKLKKYLQKGNVKIDYKFNLFTQVVNLNAMENSMVFWMGEKQQYEYENLISKYIYNIKKGLLQGRLNKELTGIEGTGLLLNNHLNKVITTFDKRGKP